MVVSKLMIRIMGIFSPFMREVVEMFYQNDRDYVFDSSKFEKHFNFQPTSYEEGVKQVVEQNCETGIRK
jgi:nucleoside-diphosphate-sugar epimerase